MKRFAICIALLPGCTSMQSDQRLVEAAEINLEVDCEKGSRVRFGGTRDQDEKQSGETTEVDPSKLKGE